jgi:thiamine biosynthesis lipoprotein
MTDIGIPTATSLIRSDPDSFIKAHRFPHQAMATVFEILCVHEDGSYAEQAAREAFDLIDRIETELTCHRSSSDISRINRLKSGESTPVGVWTMECLLLARHFYNETGGAFDITLGSGFEAIELIPAEFKVRVHTPIVRLDLGGIGKGYAIDRAGEVMAEWEIHRALLHAGFSSVLALEAPPGSEGWPLTISAPSSAAAHVLARFASRRQAWSASGIRKKDHIVNPKTGAPVRTRPAVWVSGSLEALAAAYPRGKSNEKSTGPADDLQAGDSPAAVAEALSTAGMVMTLEEIADYCLKHPGVEVRVLTAVPSDPSASPVLVHFMR